MGSMDESANYYINVFSTIGVFIAAYSYYVKIKHRQSPTYKALCDINDKMSCSRVLTSELVGKWFKKVFFCIIIKFKLL